MAREPQIQIKKSKRTGYWIVRVIGANGKILATSELFTRRRNAEKNVYAVANAFELFIDGSITVKYLD